MKAKINLNFILKLCAIVGVALAFVGIFFLFGTGIHFDRYPLMNDYSYKGWDLVFNTKGHIIPELTFAFVLLILAIAGGIVSLFCHIKIKRFNQILMVSSGVVIFIASVLFFCTLQLGGYKFYQTPNLLPGLVGMPVNVAPRLGWGNAVTASFSTAWIYRIDF